MESGPSSLYRSAFAHILLHILQRRKSVSSTLHNMILSMTNNLVPSTEVDSPHSGVRSLTPDDWSDTEEPRIQHILDDKELQVQAAASGQDRCEVPDWEQFESVRSHDSSTVLTTSHFVARLCVQIAGDRSQAQQNLSSSTLSSPSSALTFYSDSSFEHLLASGEPLLEERNGEKAWDWDLPLPAPTVATSVALEGCREAKIIGLQEHAREVAEEDEEKGSPVRLSYGHGTEEGSTDSARSNAATTVTQTESNPLQSPRQVMTAAERDKDVGSSILN